MGSDGVTEKTLKDWLGFSQLQMDWLGFPHIFVC
jgi:hypothetical protein